MQAEAMNQQVAEINASIAIGIERIKKITVSEESLAKIRNSVQVVREVTDQTNRALADANAAIEGARSIKVAI
ncbi:MAG: hypothetical protein MJ154_00585 [Candidatus Saccharibacteria bacterium]|nr:hypothetical protein [Candidatus Saccharibacteria bacterium]